MTRVHTDPTNAARVRQEQTDAKTLTRSQNEYESITFEQCCEQVPNEAAVEAELEEHASLQHGHGTTPYLVERLGWQVEEAPL